MCPGSHDRANDVTNALVSSDPQTPVRACIALLLDRHLALDPGFDPQRLPDGRGQTAPAQAADSPDCGAAFRGAWPELAASPADGQVWVARGWESPPYGWWVGGGTPPHSILVGGTGSDPPKPTALLLAKAATFDPPGGTAHEGTPA